MATIDNTDDLLRLVREDSDFRATMRRELLTAELLEVPQRLTALEQSTAALIEYTNATNRRLDNIEADSTVIKDDINVMKGDITVMKDDINVMKDDVSVTKNDVSVIKDDINGLGEAFRREVQAQSSYRGNYAQSAATGSNQDIARPFAELRGMKRIKTRQVSRARMESWLVNNVSLVEALDLRPRAWDTFLTPDDIAGVRDLQAENDAEPAFYIVVEASYTGEAEDIDKAIDHAKIVHAVTGLDAYPIVAAVRLDDKMEPETRSRLYDDVQEFVAVNDADAAFWYRLGSADLRPDEPR